MIIRKGQVVYRLTKTLSGVVMEEFECVYGGFHSASMVFEGERGDPTDEGGMVYTFKRPNASNLRIQMSELDFETFLQRQGKIVVWCLRNKLSMFKEKLDEGNYDCDESSTKKKRTKEEVKFEINDRNFESRKTIDKRKKNRKRGGNAKRSTRKNGNGTRRTFGPTIKTVIGNDKQNRSRGHSKPLNSKRPNLEGTLSEVA